MGGGHWAPFFGRGPSSCTLQAPFHYFSRKEKRKRIEEKRSKVKRGGRGIRRKEKKGRKEEEEEECGEKMKKTV